MYLKILEQQFNIQEIKQGNFSLEGDEFVDNILIFCFEWLNGKEEFTMQSSGSTGSPKPITVKRSQMLSSANATAKILGLTKNNKALCCLNTDYIAGRMMIVRAIEIEMDLWIIKPTSNPFKNPFLPSFDFIALAPIQVQASFDNTEELTLIKHSKNIIIGGAPISSHLEKLIHQHLSHTKVYMTYGMTESVSHIALRKISSESDQLYHTLESVSIGIDERNCLNIIAPMTDFKRIQTNDVVKIISSSSFQWLGRADNIINSGGVKIQAEKVEKIAYKGLETLNYLSVNLFLGGVPHDKYGEEANLFIEGISLSLNEQKLLLTFLSKHLDKYEIPKNIYAVGSFKKTETLKVKRKETIAAFLENL